MKKILLVFIPAAVFILLSGVILVSITWTHRPDLSVMDILREFMTEIKKTIAKSNPLAERKTK